MKKMRYFLLAVLMVASLILVSCSNEYANLEEYQFNKSSDPKLVYADENKVIINDGEDMVVESRGNFYRLPIKLNLGIESFILTSPSGKNALIGTIDKDGSNNIAIVNFFKGSKLTLDQGVIRYVISNFYSMLPSDYYFAYTNKGSETIKLVDLDALKIREVKVNVPVNDAIGVKRNTGYQIYFESSGKIYKKLEQEEPKLVTNGYLLSVDENSNVYFYRNINIKTTKIYKVDKNGREKEIALIDKPNELIKRGSEAVIFITAATDKQFLENNIEFINLITGKRTALSGNLNDVVPLLYDRGNIAIVFYRDGRAQIVDTRTGKIELIENFDKYVLSDLKMTLGLNVYKNYPIKFNKIVQLRKENDNIRLLLVDSHSKILKILAQQQLKD
ncbi:hypothetical protein M2349_002634 [Caldanaerobacter subterraneus subsp. tengcongensis MB4]|uniref:Lipoprotein n=1 Tax=Caldanaerobacter subterraneus subsp. tengcongensis (strain DSM 15242 / JCM 11007 / NBRC 100824 / MB4) TaxID=273068 RepID=Q8R7B3_CALS4|nr:hypothetical protein [Caldanaerobacter subterraneus]AAM25634.1 hypothetical protein TTE2505 [Caldanaerobacter subterraneus subsp. tengcongensis MB4]MCS3917493.1 hypothetical protein [Caldanaerobacter subterraneus subsp. tengcongensis MB4]